MHDYRALVAALPSTPPADLWARANGRRLVVTRGSGDEISAEINLGIGKINSVRRALEEILVSAVIRRERKEIGQQKSFASRTGAEAAEQPRAVPRFQGRLVCYRPEPNQNLVLSLKFGYSLIWYHSLTAP